MVRQVHIAEGQCVVEDGIRHPGPVDQRDMCPATGRQPPDCAAQSAEPAGNGDDPILHLSLLESRATLVRHASPFQPRKNQKDR